MIRIRMRLHRSPVSKRSLLEHGTIFQFPWIFGAWPNPKVRNIRIQDRIQCCWNLRVLYLHFQIHLKTVLNHQMLTIEIVPIVTWLVGSGFANSLWHLENCFSCLLLGSTFQTWMTLLLPQPTTSYKKVVESRRFKMRSRLTHRKIPWRRALSSFAFISTEQDPSDSHLDVQTKVQANHSVQVSSVICCQASSAH